MINQLVFNWYDLQKKKISSIKQFVFVFDSTKSTSDQNKPEPISKCHTNDNFQQKKKTKQNKYMPVLAIYKYSFLKVYISSTNRKSLEYVCVCSSSSSTRYLATHPRRHKSYVISYIIKWEYMHWNVQTDNWTHILPFQHYLLLVSFSLSVSIIHIYIYSVYLYYIQSQTEFKYIKKNFMYKKKYNVLGLVRLFLRYILQRKEKKRNNFMTGKEKQKKRETKQRSKEIIIFVFVFFFIKRQKHYRFLSCH